MNCTCKSPPLDGSKLSYFDVPPQASTQNKPPCSIKVEWTCIQWGNGVCVSYQVFHTLVHCIRHTSERLLFTSVMASSALVPSVWHTITVFLCSRTVQSSCGISDFEECPSDVLHFLCTCIVEQACHKLVVHTWRWQIMHAQQALVKTAAAAPPPGCHKEDSSRGQMLHRWTATSLKVLIYYLQDA